MENNTQLKDRTAKTINTIITQCVRIMLIQVSSSFTQHSLSFGEVYWGLGSYLYFHYLISQLSFTIMCAGNEPFEKLQQVQQRSLRLSQLLHNTT